jgi:hypothetical protein
MAFQLSPGVNVSEIDLTTVVPSVATTDGAFAGVFRWGPIGERVLVDSEDQLVARFGKPTNFNPETFFTAANFLSYANRLWVSRAANTTGATPMVPGVADPTGNVVTLDTTNLRVGQYVTQTSDPTVVISDPKNYIVSKNSEAIVLSKAPLKPLPVTLYFGNPETAYTAVGFDSANGSARVANLVHQIVKNQNDYNSKEGTFDSDVIYLAKYPGRIGNSLRVGVCDNPNSFSSVVELGQQSNNSANVYIEFRIGDRNAYVKIAGANTESLANIASQITIGDQIRAGNASIGQQYLQVISTSIASNTSAFTVVNGQTGVKGITDFLELPNSIFANGDVVYYANTNDTGAITGLIPETNYFVVDANTSGMKLSLNPFGAPVQIEPTVNAVGVFTSNSSTLAINFEDPYRLREDYVATHFTRFWEFFNVFDSAPGQSPWQLNNGNTSALDEIHVVVVDDGGVITGTPGTVLEPYKALSRATDAKNVDGSGNYYKDVINQSSRYIWWANDRSVAPSANASNLTTSTAAAPADVNMLLGADGFDEATAPLNILGQAWDLFASPEDVDISLVLQGKPVGGVTVVNGQTVVNYQLANYLIDNIVERRKDCIALISPDKSTVINNLGAEAVSLKNWRGAVSSTSYAVMDSGYKYQYDRYNDLYRWIPLNADIAGTCVRTDNTNDAWWSPAGYNRGNIKNVIKLAYNPNKSARDILYSNGINPIITQPGQGTVLFGDKTLQAKPSAFDRINVRRLFIVLEKAISTAAKYSLFEFNDAFTRAQFRNLITPYLRTVQGRRGITEFKVVCDETNNTPAIIDSNQFVGDIYIKPARSINFIQLNFVAVPSGVQFSEVIGKF